MIEFPNRAVSRFPARTFYKTDSRAIFIRGIGAPLNDADRLGLSVFEVMLR